ncbi:MAG: DUF4198 domain-containing protein [Porticoccaceae bacterium]
MLTGSKSLAIAALLSSIGSFSLSTQAHTPYLAPGSFTPLQQGWVTLDASFADTFFVPEVVFDNSEFAVLNPAGQWETPATVERLRTRAVVEHRLGEKGTYRFSTGVRQGAIFRFYELDGERKATRDPDEVLPAGATLLDHFQAITLAETYITQGPPTEAALKARGQGLEVVAVTHPSDVYEGEAFRVQVLFDGKALAEQDIRVFAANGGDDEPVIDAKTDKEGFVDLTPPAAGVYLLQIRYRHPAPAGAAAPNYSHTYTLAFEVAQQ